MGNHLRMRWLVLVFALFVVASCKKESTAETAADAKAVEGAPSDPVTVLDPGQDPKLRLRYRIPEGTTTASTATFRLATLATSKDAAALSVLPGLRIDVVSGPARVTDDGVAFAVDIVKAEAVVPPDFNESLKTDLQAGAAILDDFGAMVEINDRGLILRGEFNEAAKRSDIPMRLIRMLVNTRTTVTRVLLPEEPVGIGAKWRTKRVLQVYGFEVTQYDTYQLVDQAGDELMLNLTVQQMGLPQEVSFPEEGIAIAVESMAATATGQIILNLDALESDASANGTANDEITVTTPEGTEKIEIDESFDLQVANTTNLMPLEEIPDAPRKRRRAKKKKSKGKN